MPKIGGVLVVPRSHGTRSELSHRSPDMSFSSVIAMLHDASHRYSLVTVVFAPMRGGYPPARSASKREKTRPAPPLHRPFREKVRPASTKTPNLGCFKRAGRTFSRFRDHTTPQGELFRTQMKPTPPLLAPSRARMKPTAPLRAFNTRKTGIFPVQRRHRFQASAHTRLQRCHRFHRDEAVH